MTFFNPNLILPKSPELDRPYTFPMAAHYKKGKLALCFIAGRHEYITGSSTHRLIDNEWESFRPKAVVLEGYTNKNEPAWNETIKNLFVERALYKRNENPLQQNEARYTLLKAYENNIAIYSGETSDERKRNTIERSGYTALDYAGFIFITRLSCEANFIELTEANMPQVWQKLSPNPELNFEQFRLWHRQFMGCDFSVSAIEKNQPFPSYVLTNKKWQKLDRMYSQLRNQSALLAIDTALNVHNCVMVVYGGSHYGCLRPALDTWLGPPVIKVLS